MNQFLQCFLSTVPSSASIMRFQVLSAIIAVFFVENIRPAPVSEEKSLSLYSSDDDVEVLTAVNFKEKVVNSPTSWVVLFYLNWCGDCQRFSPFWKNLASDIYQWRDMVRIGAIDCANETNTPMCQNYKIVRYPAIKHFPEFFKDGSDGTLIQKSSNVEWLRHRIIDKIIKQSPYEKSDFSGIFEGVKDDTQFVFLVIEPPQSYLGAEASLDLHKTPKIAIKYAFSNNSALIADLTIEKFPKVVVFDRKNTPQVLPGVVQSRKDLKGVIKTFLGVQGLKVVEDLPPKKNSVINLTKNHPRNVLRQRIKRMGGAVFQMDLETALRYSLKQEIATYKSLDDEKLNALRAYLGIIYAYFPFSPRAKAFIEDLQNITNLSRVEGWKIGEIVLKYENSDYKVFSSPQRFLACEGSIPGLRGYPCSLWTLFHYLTVQAAEDQYKGKNSREVLDAMYGYITYFFSCEACSEHFQEMASQRGISDVSSADEAVLWLWGAHNEVNKRLKGDATEDPEHPKIQFPGKEFCQSCYNDDDSWNSEEVLKYLKMTYGNLNVRYIGTDTTILFDGLD